MSWDAEIREFVDSLANATTPDELSVNIYRNKTRCANLVRWMRTFEDEQGSAIFVAEAPGMLGAKITGVPLTSPYVILSETDPWKELRLSNGYEIPADENLNQKEKSATRMWKHMPPCFQGLPRPLIWNIYPFWPYKIGAKGETKNRGLTKVEKDFGKQWLIPIIEMFPRSTLVATGKEAETTLKSLGFDVCKVPHPSRGSDAKLIAALRCVATKLRAQRIDV